MPTARAPPAEGMGGKSANPDAPYVAFSPHQTCIPAHAIHAHPRHVVRHGRQREDTKIRDVVTSAHITLVYYHIT